jgi:glutamate dehydrogenase/leucine dehydrogenase
MMESWRALTDELGPSQIVLIRDVRVGLHGIAVLDNAACGPAIGGIRMHPDVTPAEVARLARAMTLKNAAAGLPHGGCKAGIAADPATPALAKERLVRAFARAIRALPEFIAGPDMGTDEACMGYVHDEIGRAVGLPRSLGGIPLDEIGATGFGLAIAAVEAAPAAGIDLRRARVAVQGFGAVGRHVARFLAERGATIVAVSDRRGGVHAPGGLDVAALTAHKASGRPVSELPGGRPISHAEMLAVACDVWIPAAQPDVIDERNAATLQARLVLPGANIAVTPAAEASLAARGVLVMPDYVVNAGGVICAAVEYAGGTQGQAFATIEEKLAANTRAVLAGVARGQRPREAADAMALARVHDAMRYRSRGW